MSNAGPRLTPAPADPFVAQHAGLVEIHHALVGSLHAVASAASAPLDVLVGQALAAGQFLLGHHHVETTVLFAGLRRRGRLRSADASFLDACDREHHELHAVCERLLASAGAPHPKADEIVALAGETRAMLAPHVHEEEAGLAPERLRAMITVEGLAEIARELETLRRGG
ncbi:MAG: hemerythrin domain-containing protein [Labilithrix sp.]|nr:hemerythrin domain-containing protein [Labilithrix sp.]